MSKILCIIDGMTDPAFRGWDYPNLESMTLSRKVDTTQGQEPESLGCILRLLGVKKVPANLRGYAEALGNQIPVGSNDLVLRGSWFALDAGGHCTVPVPAPETLSGRPECRYVSLGQYKSLLILPGMASFVSDLVTYPPHQCVGQPAQSLCPQGCGELTKVFQENMEKDRCLIPWGQAVCTAMAPFPQKAAVVCGTPIVKGIARLLGMHLVEVPGATGDVDTDLLGKAWAAVAAAKEYPFVLLHINGADEAAHRRDAAGKAGFLHLVDEVVLPILLRSGHEIQVVSDHGTDPFTGCHVGGGQPLYTNLAAKPGCKKQELAQEALQHKKAAAEQRREWAITRLKEKAEELGRIPHKADFTDMEKMRIKCALGPWPRALEAAQLKERKPKQKK